MAGLAGCGGGDVRGRFGFHIGIAAAMAGRAASSDAAVVHGGRFKGRRIGVAGLARRRGRDVRRRFT